MRYHQILHDDMRNGDGLRVVLFVAGCEHHCPGCFNPETHDFNSGIPFDEAAIHEIETELAHDYISGLSILGGSPLHPKNVGTVTELCKRVKEKFPNKNIWVWTGYRFKDVKDLEVMKYIDVLVDGKFIEELKDVKYEWRGSVGQVIWRKQKGSWVALPEENAAKPIEGFEDYLVFKDGRVFSTKRNIFLSQRIETGGYVHYALLKDGISYERKAHKLVADAFIPNPSNFKEINHKDENKNNNSADNLEWCNRSYNVNYGTRNEKMSTAVYQFSLDGKFIKKHLSIRKASRDTNTNRHVISRCIRGMADTAGGYVWKRE